jgi:broad specificity phosphatase PhoE
MVTTLCLVRHGATDTGAHRYHGSTDVSLSDEGVRQMKLARTLIGHYLAERERAAGGGPEAAQALTAVYCSDLQRSVRSAAIFAGPYGLHPVLVAALRERHFGMWEGMTFAGLEEKYPAEFEAWMANPVEYRPPGGESAMEVSRRATAAIGEIVGRHPGETIATVAHGGVNRVVLCRFMGVPLEHLFRIEQDHGAVNIIELIDGYPVVKLVNGRLYG